jgi:hypothetical protein
MKLSELKMLLAEDSEKDFRIVLPDGATVPVSFHVTEVGRIQKTFLDCGGKLRERVTCQLQVWVGEDYDHRIEVEKMASILEIAKPYLPDESIPVEIEYERNVISQYTIQGTEISDDSVVLQLAHKPTEFLTTEFCGLPAIPVKAQKSEYCCSHE